MVRRVLLLFCIILSVPATVHAEKNPAVTTLSARLLKKAFLLRSFSPETTIHYRVSNGLVVTSPPPYKIASLFKVNAVFLRNNTLHIAGRSTPLSFQDGKMTRSELDYPVEILVEVAGADLATISEALPASLFFFNIDEMKKNLPSTFLIENKRAELQACDCAQVGTASCKLTDATVGMDGLTPPSMLKSVDIDFSNSVRASETRRVVALMIDTSGNPQDLWITVSSGPDSDLPSILAAKRYKFKPATCHGAPVSIPMIIETATTTH